MAENVIEVRGLGKKYRLGQQQAAYGSLRESLSSAFRPGRRGRGPREDFWALRDVDLDVREGEALGIIGTNGAGKSTLLRILSRITEPSVGMARTRGRVGVLLEVGTGFHPELTGRENVYLSGAVMGMTRREVRRHYDEIVAFSGVERFLETPLKRYSSGMQLRLAFAVAAHLEPELMLVDEILAVGDVEFQRRCLQRMNRLSEEGRTVIFVSHDLGAISRLCSRAILIEKGRVAQDGEPAEIIQSYYSAIMGEAGQAEFDVDEDVGLKHVAIVDDRGDLLPQPTRGEPFRVRARVVASGRVPHVDISMQVYASDGSVVLDEAWADQEAMPQLLSGPGEYVVDLRVPQLLPSGDYILGLWLGSVHKTYFHREALRFSVQPRRRRPSGLADASARWSNPRSRGPGGARTVITGTGRDPDGLRVHRLRGVRGSRGGARDPADRSGRVRMAPDPSPLGRPRPRALSWRGSRRSAIASRIVPAMPEGLRGAARAVGLARMLRAERPDVFHAHLTWPFGCKWALAAACAARVPAVLGTAQLFVDVPVGPSRRAQVWALARRVDRIIAVSDHTRQRYHDALGWPLERLTVVPNAVDVERFAGPPDPAVARGAGGRIGTPDRARPRASRGAEGTPLPPRGGTTAAGRAVRLRGRRAAAR